MFFYEKGLTVNIGYNGSLGGAAPIDVERYYPMLFNEIKNLNGIMLLLRHLNIAIKF